MNVVLLIMKILGVILLVILGLIPLLLLLVLCVPFRYSGRVRKEEKLEGLVRFTWLLRLFDVRVPIEKGSIVPEIRIAWFFRKKIEPKEKEEKKPEEQEEKPEEKEKLSLKERWKTISGNLKKLELLAESERVQNAVSKGMKALRDILRSMIPKKLSGFLNVGLSDPYQTGKLLAFFAETIPVHKNAVEIEPDFEHEVFRTDVTMSGRWIFIVPVAKVLALLLNSDVRYTIRLYRKYFGKTKKEETQNG